MSNVRISFSTTCWIMYLSFKTLGIPQYFWTKRLWKNRFRIMAHLRNILSYLSSKYHILTPWFYMYINRSNILAQSMNSVHWVNVYLEVMWQSLIWAQLLPIFIAILNGTFRTSPSYHLPPSHSVHLMIISKNRKNYVVLVFEKGVIEDIGRFSTQKYPHQMKIHNNTG